MREATSDEAWGPHGTVMKEIAQMTFKYELFNEVMNALWKRVFQPEKDKWRSTYKALVMLAYLMRNGSDKVVSSCRDHLFDLKSLEGFSYVDEKGKDQGVNSTNEFFIIHNFFFLAVDRFYFLITLKLYKFVSK